MRFRRAKSKVFVNMVKWDGAIASREEIRELKRRAALRVASKIFNEKGYHATSLDEIAEKIGVTKTALYYYFKNKEQLLYESLVLSYDCGQTARVEAENLNGSAYDKLRHLYRRFIELLIEVRGAYTTLANINALPEDKRGTLIERRRQLDRYSRSLLDKAIADGDLRPVDVRVASNYFLGAVNWILRWYTDEDSKSPEEISEIFLDLMLHGVAKTNPDEAMKS